MNEQMLMFLVGQVFTAAGIYAAIRADLREALVRMKEAERRLDRLEGEDRRHAERRRGHDESPA